jgi:transcription elongation factor GreB
MVSFSMSKAFTRESDDVEVEPIVARPVSTLPPGLKNYLTADGAQRLREELNLLLEQRPHLLAVSHSGSDTKRQLQILDQRIALLQQSLHTAVVVPRPEGPEDHVKFGATVTVRERSGEEVSYRIVGADEMDLDRNWISFFSPIARALMNAQVGQRVRLKLPAGQEELEIMQIQYE